MKGRVKRAHGNLTAVAEKRKKMRKGQGRDKEYATSRTDKSINLHVQRTHSTENSLMSSQIIQ